MLEQIEHHDVGDDLTAVSDESRRQQLSGVINALCRGALALDCEGPAAVDFSSLVLDLYRRASDAVAAEHRPLVVRFKPTAQV